MRREKSRKLSELTMKYATYPRLALVITLWISFHSLASAQLHFSTPISVTRAEMMTGSAAVDEKINEFFDNLPGYSLSTNIEWIPGTEDARLDGGTHGIEQTLTITVGNSLVANRQREHSFNFSLQLLRNANGDYTVRFKWSITDNSEYVTVHGEKSLYRVIKSSPGQRIMPEQLQPTSSEVLFKFGNVFGSSGGSYVWTSIPAQRAYWREDGAFVTEAYTIKIQVWLPDTSEISNQNVE